MSAERLDFRTAFGLWLDGQRRLTGAPPDERAEMERVADALVEELRRRLGGQFGVEELAEMYWAGGTDWCFDIATRVAPRCPAAWEMPTVAGSAFARYAREAVDYSEGRRLSEQPPPRE